MVAAAAVTSERGPFGVRVMEHGKDYFTDKAPFTTMDQLRKAKETVARTGKKYMVYYSERLHVESAVYAGELIKQGAHTATSASDILNELALSYPTKIHPEYLLTSKKIYAYGNASAAPAEEEPFELPAAEPVPAPPPPPPKKEPELPIPKKICSALKGRSLTADELAALTGIGIGDLLAELTELEIDGKIHSLPGNRFTCI